MEKFYYRLLRTSFLIIICCIYSSNIFCTDLRKYKIELYVFKDKYKINIYNSFKKDSIIATLLEDSSKERLNGFDVLEKQDGMILVIAWNTNNNIRIKGWIEIKETAIYGRDRNNIYELYNNPNYNSKKILINSDWDCYIMRDGIKMKAKCNIDSFFNILDISGKWVKVKVIGKDNIYIKWLPREYQCHNINGGCT